MRNTDSAVASVAGRCPLVHWSTGTVVYGFTRPLLASRIYWPQNIETGNSPAESSREKDSVLEGLKTATLTVKLLMSITGWTPVIDIRGGNYQKQRILREFIRGCESAVLSITNCPRHKLMHPEQDQK